MLPFESGLYFFASPITEAIFSVLTAVLTSMFLQKFTQHKPTVRHTLLTLLSCMLLSGILILLIKNAEYVRYLVIPISIPLLYSYVAAVRDKKCHPFSILVYTLILTYAFFYHIAMAVMELWTHSAATLSAWPTNISASKHTLALMLTSVLMLFLLRSRWISVETIRTFMNNKESGAILKIFILLSAISLVYSDCIIVPTVRNTGYTCAVSTHFSNVFYAEILVRTLTNMVIGFILVMMYARNLHYRGQVQKEQSFRSGLEAKALFTYEVNLSKDRMVHGREVFLPQLWDGTDSYRNMITNYAATCVHPEDWDVLREAGKPSFYFEKLKNNPSYFLRFRVSPSAMLSVIAFRDDLHEKFRSMESDWVWLQIHSVVLKNHADELYLFVSLTDVDEQVRQEQQLRERALVDPLTKLYNRNALETKIEEFLSNPSANISGTLLLLDLDHFKSVNDTFGHPTGDKLLVETAEILRSMFRSNDIIARLGGDEFAVFLVGMNSASILEEKLIMLGEKLRREITGADGRSIRVSSSIGAACYPIHGESYEELYQGADKALYAAKEAGRDTFKIFESCSDSTQQHTI